MKLARAPTTHATSPTPRTHLLIALEDVEPPPIGVRGDTSFGGFVIFQRDTVQGGAGLLRE